MQYQVWVAAADGSGRIPLADLTDGQAAAQLVSALVGFASGESFSIGVTVAKTETPPAPSGKPPAHAQPAPRQPR